jgi:CRISPR system Cascade subunit CasE
MYLSKLTLDIRNNQSRRLLGDCHALHRLIMSGFPEAGSDAARAEMGVLFRVEPVRDGGFVPVLVQSRVEPRWVFESREPAVDGPRSIDGFLGSLRAGQRLRFRLHGNPTRRVHARAALGPHAERGRARAEEPGAVGKRVELRREEDQLAWLTRKAAGKPDGPGLGFRLVTTELLPSGREAPATRADPGGKLHGKRPGDERLTIAMARFEGVLEVQDQALLRQAIADGIGPAKAFGCGLLSVATVR